MEGQEVLGASRSSARVLACVVGLGLLAAAGPAHAASGVWERAWGGSVDAVAPGPGPEICVVAANCEEGISGTGVGGEFDQPTGIAADAAGNVYVADPSNSRVQKFDSTGHFLRMWGRDVVASGPGDTSTDRFEICVAGLDTCQVGVTGDLGGEMTNPHSIAVDSEGNVYVSDSGNLRILKFNSAGTFLLAWGKDVVDNGANDGFEICDPSLDTCQSGAPATGPGGELAGPNVISAAAGSVYVTDGGDHGRIQKFDSNGHFLRMWGRDVVASGPGNTSDASFEICTIAANCKTADGTMGRAGELDDTTGIAVDPAGDVYVGEINFFGRRVQKFDSNGNFLRLWGKNVVSAGPGDTGTGPEICVAGVDTCQHGESGPEAGALGSPLGIATDAAGAVYIADGGRIQKFDSSGNFLRLWGKDVVSAGPGNTGSGFEICVAGFDTCTGGTGGSPALGGEMGFPASLSTDSTGSLYVVEEAYSRVEQFAADPSPETTIVAGPNAFPTPSPTFELASSDPGSTFECSLDGGAFGACSSSFSTPSLTDGAHELQARAIDPARQVDATAASRAFTVDTTAPETQVDSGPAAGAMTNDTTPTFEFSSSEPGSTFECRIDAGAFASCSGPHTPAALGIGRHTFEVRATDAVGNLDATPASRTFTVDADRPETTIDKAPKKKSSKRKAKFAFSSDEPGSTFECMLDKGEFGACGATVKFKVKTGKHKLQVRATDAVGNVDQTPAVAKWKVKRKK
jgi:hypothetical protein